jgi:hypothetical protein
VSGLAGDLAAETADGTASERTFLRPLGDADLGD